MRQGKLFFEEMAYQRLDKGKDPLVTLAETVDWRIFEEPLRAFRESLRTTGSPAGRKPFDPLLMFKILVLGSLYNLSDDAMEYQIRMVDPNVKTTGAARFVKVRPPWNPGW